MSIAPTLRVQRPSGELAATTYVAQPVVGSATSAARNAVASRSPAYVATPVEASRATASQGAAVNAASVALVWTAEPADGSARRSPWYALIVAAIWHARLLLSASFLSAAMHAAAVVTLSFIVWRAEPQEVGKPPLQAALQVDRVAPPPPPKTVVVLRPQAPNVNASEAKRSGNSSGSVGSQGGSGGGNRGGVKSFTIQQPTLAKTDAGGTGFGLERAFGRDMLTDVGEPSEAGAMFFGVKATGSNFAFVVDTSGSMAMNNRFLRCRDELFRSLTALKYTQKFYIVYFNDTTFPMPEHKLVDAKPAQLRKTMTWALGAVPSGSTEPWDGLAMALRLKPDAIYLLTDGQFSPGVIERIQNAQSNGKKIPIHTIAFESQIGEQLLLTISRLTGGTYKYVP